MFRFILRTLLILISLLACAVAFATQYGTADAHFEIIENALVADDNGRLNGKIRWDFRDEFSQETKALQFICSVNDLKLDPESSSHLLAKGPGDQTRVRYRHHPLWPIKKEDPFEEYISHDLGIDPECIVGYVWFDGWAEVIISGQLR